MKRRGSETKEKKEPPLYRGGFLFLWEGVEARKTVMALKEEYVAQMPEAQRIFDFLERHYPKLVNAVENPLIPLTNNTVELVIRRFDQHYQNMCGFDSIQTACKYLHLFELTYRFPPFAQDHRQVDL